MWSSYGVGKTFLDNTSCDQSGGKVFQNSMCKDIYLGYPLHRPPATSGVDESSQCCITISPPLSLQQPHHPTRLRLHANLISITTRPSLLPLVATCLANCQIGDFRLGGYCRPTPDDRLYCSEPAYQTPASALATTTNSAIMAADNKPQMAFAMFGSG